MAWSIPWDLIGLQVSGDVGGFSIYTDRFGKKVVYPKAPPEKPPSAEQTHLRSRFATAQADWMSQTAEVKADLEEMCRKANVPMTGQNLWISVALKNDASAMLTLQRQTGIVTPIPEYVP